MPIETVNAYRDHGQPVRRLEDGIQESYRVMEGLRQAGIDLDALTQQLEDEGVAKFNTAFDQLMTALDEKRTVSVP